MQRGHASRPTVGWGGSHQALARSSFKPFTRTAVQAVNDSRGYTSVSPDLRTCCACRAYQHACDGLAFKFTEQMVDSELPSPNPRRSELSTILLTDFFPLTIYRIENLSTTFSQILFFLLRKKVERMACVASPAARLSARR